MSTRTHIEDFVEREMTLEEWAAMDEDAEGELVDGRLVVEEEVGTIHDVVGGWLVTMIGAWLQAHGGTIGLSDTRFAVSGRRGRKPDVYVYLGERRPPATNLVRTPPDIMIEIVTPNPRDQRRDRIEKLNEYGAFGVRWYWLVEPTPRTFQIFELTEDGHYLAVVSATDGSIDAIPGLPGFSLDLDAMWAVVDSLPPEAP